MFNGMAHVATLSKLMGTCTNRYSAMPPHQSASQRNAPRHNYSLNNKFRPKVHTGYDHALYQEANDMRKAAQSSCAANEEFNEHKSNTVRDSRSNIKQNDVKHRSRAGAPRINLPPPRPSSSYKNKNSNRKSKNSKKNNYIYSTNNEHRKRKKQEHGDHKTTSGNSNTRLFGRFSSQTKQNNNINLKHKYTSSEPKIKTKLPFDGKEIWDANVETIAYDATLQQEIATTYPNSNKLWIYNPISLIKLCTDVYPCTM